MNVTKAAGWLADVNTQLNAPLGHTEQRPLLVRMCFTAKINIWLLIFFLGNSLWTN